MKTIRDLASMLALAVLSTASAQTFKMTTPIAPGVAVPDKIESSIGTLNLDHGYPSADTVEKIYDNLDPWDVVKVSRHPERPQTLDYLELVFDEFVELHGDKAFGADRAILTGFATLEDRKVMFIGQNKGRSLKERTVCFYGCAQPEG